MFVSQDKNVGKKPFQKPNILRRKPKASTSRVKKESSCISLVSGIETQPDQLDIIQCDDAGSTANVNQTVCQLTLSCCKDMDEIQPETDIDANMKSDNSIYNNINISKSVDQGINQNSLNIESFLNTEGDNFGNQDLLPSVAISNVLPDTKIIQDRKWCLDIPSNNMNIVIENCDEPQLLGLEQQSSILESTILVPSSGATNIPVQPEFVVQTSTAPAQTIFIGGLSSRAIKLKCDYPNCNKGFWNAEKLEKHKNSHNRPIVRSATVQTYSCPVKKTVENGAEERCPRTFTVRADLLKHLNEEHTLEDAQYRCLVCGRRFFWASGLRAHGASVCARGGLACSWPGCGRVFSLPCRLREHARAHTGDRPYLCHYPDCGWAFRSASKLVRHSRRHTGERRHACSSCGRAFLRREHLRDHISRHHAPTKRDPHVCTHPGCEQSFTNMSTLYMHMKKVHRKVEEKPTAQVLPVVTEPEQPPTVQMPEDTDNIYLVNLVSSDVPCGSPEQISYVEDGAEIADMGEMCEGDGEMEAEGEGEGEGGRSARAARTHCTWPLPRTSHYGLDDDGQTERGEGSASDVYTVRSDLFLHGNLTVDEDSQHISSATSDAGLGYIDAHPTIDLMQEDLMYEAGADDESSFRVLLMTGDDLT